MSAVETTPVEDLEALVALLAAAELSAPKDKAEDEEAKDDEASDDSNDDEGSDDDDDDSDDDDDYDDDESDDDDSGDDDSEDEESDDEDDDENEDDDEAEEDDSGEQNEEPKAEHEEAELEEAELEEAEVEELTAESVEAPVAVAAAAPRSDVTDVVSPDHAQHLRLLEALIFAGTQALDEKELAERLPNDADVPRLLADLAEMYANRGVNLVKVAGGYAFRTAPDLSEKLKIEKPVTRKLSRASIETLAIIAYHQPVTRAEIEQVRGVGLSKGTLDLLFEQNWIKPMGRRRAPGKPVTWGTTDFFLEHFGLPSLEDLPGHEEMKAAGLLDPRAQPPIFRPEEPDLPLEPTEDEADEPLATEEKTS
jgi:segregation and condensation protein B